ncbi:MAG: hypothetical protein MUF48_18730 [Pirellulaceae bacterium]|jgi:hypothetical protein|nr:hypothetical protein [Pirellulaceae bacterium]
MTELTEPDLALAARLLADVPHHQRLVAHRKRQRWGSIPAYLYSFGEVVRLLQDKQPALSWPALEHWLRHALRDVELADRVAEIMAQVSCEQGKTMQIRVLLERRLSQCRALAPS